MSGMWSRAAARLFKVTSSSETASSRETAGTIATPVTREAEERCALCSTATATSAMCVTATSSLSRRGGPSSQISLATNTTAIATNLHRGNKPTEKTVHRALLSELAAVTHIADVAVAVEQSAQRSSASHDTVLRSFPPSLATKLSPTS